MMIEDEKEREKIIEEIGPLVENDERWLASQDPKTGKPNMWMPYEQFVAMQFLEEVSLRVTVGPRLWGMKPLKGEERYKAAKEIYDEKYKKLNLSEGYLNHYKVENANS